MEKLTIRNFMLETQSIPFWINKTIHTHDNPPKLHFHDFVELVYVISGRGKHIFGNGSYDINSGDVYIINPGEAHTYQVDRNTPLEIVNCLFLPEFVQHNSLRELGINDSMDYYYVHPFLGKTERFNHRLNLSGEAASRVLWLLDEMIEEYERHESGYSTLVRIQLVQLLVLLSRYYGKRIGGGPGSSSPSASASGRSGGRKLLIQRILGYLERNYEKKMSIPMLSEQFNLSPRQLNRVFKEETGQTIFETIHNIRVEKAKHMLAESDEKVITIACHIGYEDPAFFNRLFQRKVGCAPGKYRERQKQFRDTIHT
jgi:AraC-like DNA-binding protein/mannose-6-phosphate isomerase-like protein (cupin superfamily)